MTSSWRLPRKASAGGEALGRYIWEHNFPYREQSVLAMGYHLGIPVTVHVGVGNDIIHEHPNCDGAATASHFVCDFMKGVSLNQKVRYDFECLNDNTPLRMAIANDISNDDVFVMPLRAKLHEGDLVIGISGSGNSENVVRAIAYAKENGAKTAALVGYSGGKLLKLADHAVHVKIDNMQIVEDVHMILDHMMMYILAACGE